MISRMFVLLALVLFSSTARATGRACASSPGKLIELCAFVAEGKALYEVRRDGKTIIEPSELGLTFQGEPHPRFSAMSATPLRSSDTSWEQPWGEQRIIRDWHSEMIVSFAGDTRLNRNMDVIFRLFDDGIGFRYRYGGIGPEETVSVVAELTQFDTKGPYQAWWYQALGQERDEYLYTETDARRITVAETPLTLRGPNGLHVLFHEAALVDFPSMLLAGDGAGTLSAWLMPWSDGVQARKTGPFETPWRTVLIADSAAALADSRITLNLNEPNRLGDVSWVRPGKYVGVWWEMHLNKSTWGSGPTHGANNANVRRYIDFAQKYGFDGVLVEGWNTGWDGDWIANGEKFSFTQSYPDFDLSALASYARSKGVKLIGHHETAGAVPNYDAQLDPAMALYARHGISVVKTGYVRHSGTITDAQGQPQWFAGQYMVNHHLRVAQVAARNRIAVDVHEPIKDTGLRRTYPNMLSREGARGQEFNAWGRPTNPPEHVTVLPFTRLLAGPMDFTPGIFDLTFGKDKLEERVQSTLATQLAEYVVIYSPVHMAADLPENYEKRPNAFKFIRDVPTDWETSRTLAGEVGDYIVVARQERGGDDWYLGAITDEQAREVKVKLDFLDPRRRYEAHIYRDGPGANYISNPHALEIEKRIVRAGEELTLAMAPGGGQAIRFRALH